MLPVSTWARMLARGVMGCAGFSPNSGSVPSCRRRGIRLALLCIVTTMAIGATMGLAGALAHRWRCGPTAEPINASRWRGSAAGVDAGPGADHASPTRLMVQGSAGAVSRTGLRVEKTTCQTWRRAANRVATVVIGRTGCSASAPEPVAATEPSKAGNAENRRTRPRLRSSAPRRPNQRLGRTDRSLTPPARWPADAVPSPSFWPLPPTFIAPPPATVTVRSPVLVTGTSGGRR